MQGEEEGRGESVRGWVVGEGGREREREREIERWRRMNEQERNPPRSTSIRLF